MKRSVIIMCNSIFLVFSTAICSKAFCQSYSKVSFYKSKTNSRQDLIQGIEKNEIKVQQNLVNQGICLSWKLYEVLSPRGTEAEYDFVAIANYGNLQNAVEPNNNQKMDNFWSMVKCEIYMSLSVAMQETKPNGEYSEYVTVDFMNPKTGKVLSYMSMEMDTVKNIHNERIKLGSLDYWDFMQMIFPYDVKKGYLFLAMNHIGNFDQMLNARYAEALKNVYPALNISELFQRIDELRDNPKGELWRLIKSAKKQIK